jgi:molybdate transport system regulatory protein
MAGCTALSRVEAARFPWRGIPPHFGALICIWHGECVPLPRAERTTEIDICGAFMRQAPRKSTRRAAALSKDRGPRAALTIRLDFGAFGYLGPGKIALMELISRHGSISAAGKELGMSYRRAWLLVDEINHIFREALVVTQMGGSGGGGARLTELGREVVARYRAIENAAGAASAAQMQVLKMCLPDLPRSKTGDR